MHIYTYIYILKQLDSALSNTFKVLVSPEVVS